jgi:hypothetical protein
MLTRASFLTVLVVALALVATGCGDKSSSDGGAAAAGATQSSSSAAGGSSNSKAMAFAEKTRASCMDAALALSDADASGKAKKLCDDAYDKIKESASTIDKTASDARANCERAADKITDPQHKVSALHSCAELN